MAKVTSTTLIGTLDGTNPSADYLAVRNVKSGTPKYGTLWLTGTVSGNVTIEGSAPDANTFVPISTFTATGAYRIQCNANEDIRLNSAASSPSFRLTFPD